MAKFFQIDYLIFPPEGHKLKVMRYGNKPCCCTICDLLKIILYLHLNYWVVQFAFAFLADKICIAQFAFALLATNFGLRNLHLRF